MRVISNRNLPAQMRLLYVETGVAYLLADKLHAPGWVFGAMFTLAAVGFVVNLYLIFKQTEIDILK